MPRFVFLALPLPLTPLAAGRDPFLIVGLARGLLTHQQGVRR